MIPVLNDNYIWLIHDRASGDTVVVDPTVADPVLAAAAERGWRISQIWNTQRPDLFHVGQFWPGAALSGRGLP